MPMQVNISSRRTHVSDRLEDLTRSKLARLDKYVPGLERADVHFCEERNPRIADKEICEVTVEGHGHHVRTKVTAPDPYTAIDIAIEKLEHQFHKLKTKLHRHEHSGEISIRLDEPLPISGDSPVPIDENVSKIVKKKQFVIEPMTADDAVLQMELLGHDFFLFTNAETNLSAVVYLRDDGDVGLIDAA
ncbi:MAG: putative sigma-54 modulation protein [Verrucomicrobiales bacterium]|jgi:putative sigma-54 modulation protein